ncbi:MAG TPA: hypothetical protein PLW65_18090 [Pseudomonadota bacterium]|nr:hypothetical protein [Pseudomonadota bacterium]
MDTELDFDPMQYSRLPPYMDNSVTLALARQLIAAAPKQASEGARGSVALLRKNSQALAEGMAVSLRESGPPDKRPVDLAADHSWGALELRLAAWLQLPADEYAQVEAATILHSQLFPDGLRFTQLEYGAQWAEAESRIQMLKSSGQLPLLERLCDKPFVTELLRCHAAYGAMVGTNLPGHAAAKSRKKTGAAGKRSEEPVVTLDLGWLRKQTQQAILAHQIQLMAMRISGSPAERAAAQAALRPLDEYREKLAPSRPAKRDEPAPAPAPGASDAASPPPG